MLARVSWQRNPWETICPPRRDEETALSGALPHNRSCSKPMRDRKTPAKKRERHWWKSATGKVGCLALRKGRAGSLCIPSMLEPVRGGTAVTQQWMSPLPPATLEWNATAEHLLFTQDPVMPHILQDPSTWCARPQPLWGCALNSMSLTKVSSARLFLCFLLTEQSVFREEFPHPRPRAWARTWWPRCEFTTGLPTAGRRRLSGTSWPWTPSAGHSPPLLPP